MPPKVKIKQTCHGSRIQKEVNDCLERNYHFQTIPTTTTLKRIPRTRQTVTNVGTSTTSITIATTESILPPTPDILIQQIPSVTVQQLQDIFQSLSQDLRNTNDAIARLDSKVEILTSKVINESSTTAIKTEANAKRYDGILIELAVIKAVVCHANPQDNNTSLISPTHKVPTSIHPVPIKKEPDEPQCHTHPGKGIALSQTQQEHQHIQFIRQHLQQETETIGNRNFSTTTPATLYPYVYNYSSDDSSKNKTRKRKWSS